MIGNKNISGHFLLAMLFGLLALVFGISFTEATEPGTGKPSLFMVAAGVSDYTDIKPLRFAHKDALDLANFYKAQEGKLFARVEATTLINTEATVANLNQALLELHSRVGPNDYVIVFLSGHGSKRRRSEYHYSAFDKDIPWTQIQTALQGVQGKILVMLDTCEAGAVSYAPHLIVFSSSLAHQVSRQELSVEGNGYFTKALLEALGGRADLDKNGTITLAEADAYVSTRVEQISKGQQSPTLLRPPNIPSSFPLARSGRPGMWPDIYSSGPLVSLLSCGFLSNSFSTR